MKTVKEVSEITGISIRALRYYDETGLLKPTALTEANYRLYDDQALERLQQILFFRELEIPLADVKALMDDPNYDKEQALLTQRSLLEHKRNRLNGIIELITDVAKGANTMSFAAFNDEEVKKVLDHSLKAQGKDSVEALIKKYGSLGNFRTSVGMEMKEQNAHYIKIYGGKEKAVEAILQSPLSAEEIKEIKEENDKTFWQFAKAKETEDEAVKMEAVRKYADTCKRLFRLDNARYLLLKVAEDYLHTQKCPELIEATNRKYGAGITEYIGQAIQQFYGM